MHVCVSMCMNSDGQCMAYITPNELQNDEQHTGGGDGTEPTAQTPALLNARRI